MRYPSPAATAYDRAYEARRRASPEGRESKRAWFAAYYATPRGKVRVAIAQTRRRLRLASDPGRCRELIGRLAMLEAELARIEGGT